MRKHFISIFFVLCFTASGSYAGEEILMHYVSIKADSITKADLLDTLSARYNIHFSYNPELLKANKRVSINIENMPLYYVLNGLIPDEIMAIRSVNTQVIFYPTQKQPPESKTNKYITISGKIVEEERELPVPYCNITIVGKALGTMSNNNGRFSVLIPDSLVNDTLAFSCMGYQIEYLPMAQAQLATVTVYLKPRTYNLKTIDIVRYEPEKIFAGFDKNFDDNYESEYTLFSAFYRELTTENDKYTNISEAVLKIMKAPYKSDFRDDLVKFIKGRKGTGISPVSDIRFTLMGGPYYITKLDVVKNNESFMKAENRHLYNYKYESTMLVNNRKTAVVSFSPVYSLRDILFEGTLYFDVETWGISRVEFNYTRQGLREARHTLIQKKPQHVRVIPEKLEYVVQYKYLDGKWYLQSARSFFDIQINNRETREKTKFKSTSEILTTGIEKGNYEKISRHEIFRRHEIFTDKISTYDPSFWDKYNVVEPEEDLTNALKNFNEQNLVVTYTY
ncbi:MAG: carboxypeptidase-like regulatory domain-containing protein [Prolixibacteraceae bacterium]|jgi:hypothetical protein|nr:carboxypeptidase-like regulatory domain-containing protein [Prolixibacteraceae bacterium]